MIVDSSALLALLFREPQSERILSALTGTRWLGIGAPTLAETGSVLEARLGSEARPTLAMLLEQLDPELVAFEAVHARIARDAFAKYGRGRHRANLNFGDCLTYAIAKVSGQPLLFVGQDFGQTDLEAVLVAAD